MQPFATSSIRGDRRSSTSTELAELVHLAHRCLVVYGGRIVGDVAGSLLTEDRLVSFATGHGDIAA